MSYEKKTWQTDDVITSAALNNIEEQVAANEAADVQNAAAISAADAKAEKGNPLRPEFTVSEDAGGALTATTDAVFADVAAAVAAGREVEAVVTLAKLGVVIYLPLRIRIPAANPTTLGFEGTLDMSAGGKTVVTMYTITFTAAGATAQASPVRGADAGEPVIVPFTVTFDDQTGEPTATTTATFSSTMSKITAGNLAVARITMELGGTTVLLYGVLSTNDSETAADRSIYTMISLPDIQSAAEPGGEPTVSASAKILVWTPEGILLLDKEFTLS